MFSVPHLVIIFVVVLVVFGPHKLPELARGLGKMMAEFRKASTDFKMAFEEEMRTIERQARETELRKVQEAAAASAVAGEQPLSAASLTAETETPKILPENIEPIEPTIVPVSESIARDSHSPEESQPSETTAAEPATAPTDEITENGKSPAHDQQQSA